MLSVKHLMRKLMHDPFISAVLRLVESQAINFKAIVSLIVQPGTVNIIIGGVNTVNSHIVLIRYNLF